MSATFPRDAAFVRFHPSRPIAVWRVRRPSCTVERRPATAPAIMADARSAGKDRVDRNASRPIGRRLGQRRHAGEEDGAGRPRRRSSLTLPLRSRPLSPAHATTASRQLATGPADARWRSEAEAVRERTRAPAARPVAPSSPPRVAAADSPRTSGCRWMASSGPRPKLARARAARFRPRGGGSYRAPAIRRRAARQRRSGAGIHAAAVDDRIGGMREAWSHVRGGGACRRQYAQRAERCGSPPPQRPTRPRSAAIGPGARRCGGARPHAAGSAAPTVLAARRRSLRGANGVFGRRGIMPRLTTADRVYN